MLFLFILYIGNKASLAIRHIIIWSLEMRYCGVPLYILLLLLPTVSSAFPPTHRIFFLPDLLPPPPSRSSSFSLPHPLTRVFFLARPTSSASVRESDSAAESRFATADSGASGRHHHLQVDGFGGRGAARRIPEDRRPPLASPPTYQMSAEGPSGYLGHARSRGSAPGLCV